MLRLCTERWVETTYWLPELRAVSAELYALEDEPLVPDPECPGEDVPAIALYIRRVEKRLEKDDTKVRGKISRSSAPVRRTNASMACSQCGRRLCSDPSRKALHSDFRLKCSSFAASSTSPLCEGALDCAPKVLARHSLRRAVKDGAGRTAPARLLAMRGT